MTGRAVGTAPALVEIEPSWGAWRAAARPLLRQGVRPEAVLWGEHGTGVQALLRASGEAPELPDDAPGLGHGDVRIPRAFVEAGEEASCHRDPGRWALLYRVAWRLTRGGEPHLLEVAVDDDIHRLLRLARAVQRDSHKMKAFGRFRRLEDGDGGERFVAWHRPDHFIVERVAPFFVDRFGAMRWSILTPDASAHWDLSELRFGPGLPRAAAPSNDELEGLWRTYYGAIFNPARLKLRAMRAEMPVRHWPTLPETSLIPELLQAAPGRVQGMIDAARRLVARDFFPAAVPDGPEGLGELAAAARACRACSLCERATQAVFGEGPADARLVLVGEQPGDQEDLAGRPFVGPAGQVLDEALAAVGIDRREVYLTNAVKHFKWEPRGVRRLHRTPTLGEVTACRPWLEEELARLRPQQVVCLGATAAQALLGPTFRLNRQRGDVFKETPWAPWVMATYHPSLLLRIPNAAQRAEARRLFLADLGVASARLRG